MKMKQTSGVLYGILVFLALTILHFSSASEVFAWGVGEEVHYRLDLIFMNMTGIDQGGQRVYGRGVKEPERLYYNDKLQNQGWTWDMIQQDLYSKILHIHSIYYEEEGRRATVYADSRDPNNEVDRYLEFLLKNPPGNWSINDVRQDVVKRKNDRTQAIHEIFQKHLNQNASDSQLKSYLWSWTIAEIEADVVSKIQPTVDVFAKFGRSPSIEDKRNFYGQSYDQIYPVVEARVKEEATNQYSGIF